MDERRRVLSVASGVALLLALIGVGVYALARARDLHLANHDIGWFLHAGGVWLAGGEIGVDIIDTNPPLVIWLSGLEVQLASWLGASPFVVHALVSCVVGLLGVGFATRAFRRAGLAREVLSLWAPLTLVAATAVSGYEFGQREHWLALLLLPYAGWAFVPRSNSSGARSLAPYSCLWPIAGNYTPEERGAARFPYRTLAEMTAVERRMVERVVAVLVRERPRLLVFDRRSRKPAFGRTALDLRRYFEAHPDFLVLLSSYRSLARDDFFEYYGRNAD